MRALFDGKARMYTQITRCNNLNTNHQEEWYFLFAVGLFVKEIHRDTNDQHQLEDNDLTPNSDIPNPPHRIFSAPTHLG